MIDNEAIAKMKKLVSVARKNGLIKPVSDAFKLYPVEEEYHKGKLEYWTRNVGL